MQIPLEVTFRDMKRSDAVENLVRKHAARLEKFCDHIDSCRVAIERPHRRRHAANDYRVRLDITVPPGHEIVITREADEGGEHHARNNQEALYKLVHQAFEVAVRQVKKVTQRQRGYVKSHPAQEVSAVVMRLLDDHGFLQTVDGREVYFHRNSVLSSGFDQLKPGVGVTFNEEQGDEGPQASSVRVLDSRGH